MSELVKQCKVKYLGLSECSVDILCRAYVIHPTAVLQVKYSPFTLEIDKNDALAQIKCRKSMRRFNGIS
ncbi:hypothetical protein PAXINDRAFT_19937 [Paxillus involutus ATCC 200175]|uniref:NADP-dependent oxidoreductase domain-containing protein n=1 Tax=Paxillus involutus ATCC 200175 TaxID=664439 RepID=A0A0C9TFG1_PAXIN|nr:hypothetical protein PAXINDRAFT_19937 [Paxillus involutus ATCC 200175]